MTGTANATLGNYPTTTVQLSRNTTVVPDAAPVSIFSINVSTSTNFKGRMEARSRDGGCARDGCASGRDLYRHAHGL